MHCFPQQRRESRSTSLAQSELAQTEPPCVSRISSASQTGANFRSAPSLPSATLLGSRKQRAHHFRQPPSFTPATCWSRRVLLELISPFRVLWRTGARSPLDMYLGWGLFRKRDRSFEGVFNAADVRFLQRPAGNARSRGCWPTGAGRDPG